MLLPCHAKTRKHGGIHTLLRGARRSLIHRVFSFIFVSVCTKGWNYNAQ